MGEGAAGQRSFLIPPGSTGKLERVKREHLWPFLFRYCISLDCFNKIPQPRGLKQQKLSSGGRNPEISGAVWLVSGQSSLPGLQIAAFLPRPHTAFLLCTRGERQRVQGRAMELCSSLGSFLKRTLILVRSGPCPYDLIQPSLLPQRLHLPTQPH